MELLGDDLKFAFWYPRIPTLPSGNSTVVSWACMVSFSCRLGGKPHCCFSLSSSSWLVCTRPQHQPKCIIYIIFPSLFWACSLGWTAGKEEGLFLQNVTTVSPLPSAQICIPDGVSQTLWEWPRFQGPVSIYNLPKL